MTYASFNSNMQTLTDLLKKYQVIINGTLLKINNVNMVGKNGIGLSKSKDLLTILLSSNLHSKQWEINAS